MSYSPPSRRPRPQRSVGSSGPGGSETRASPSGGVLKELLDRDAPPFTFEDLPRMRSNILALNELGIVAYDLRSDNLSGGRIFDLSQAITAPHLELCFDQERLPKGHVMECCTMDMVSFDDLVAEWNRDNPDRIFWSRFFPSRDYIVRLRRLPSRRHKPFYRMGGTRFTAALYGRPRHSGGKQARSPRRRMGSRKRKLIK